MKNFISIVFAVILFLIPSQALSMPTFLYQFSFGMNDSRPKGDYVQYSQEIGSVFSANRVRDFSGDGKADLVTFVFEGPAYLSWLDDTRDIRSRLTFGTNKISGVNLNPRNYPKAQRAAFADPGYAGIDYSYKYRAPNTVTGDYRIFDKRIINGPKKRENDGFEVVSFGATYTANTREGMLYYNFDPDSTRPTVPDLPFSPRPPQAPTSPKAPNLPNAPISPKPPTAPVSPTFYRGLSTGAYQLPTTVNPEPMSMMLFSTGLAGAAWFRRRNAG